MLTPDSSRFWPLDSYRPGGSPPSFDKQFVRDWLETTGWDKNSPPPALPAEVVDQTRAKYLEAYERLDRTDAATERKLETCRRQVACDSQDYPRYDADLPCVC